MLTMLSSRARMRSLVIRVALAACAGVSIGLAPVSQAGQPNGCTSIAQVAPIYSGIQYGAAIQGMFDDFNGMNVGCTMCHFTPPPAPSGHLNLDDGVSWAHLVNVSSYEDPNLIYVVPGHPERSLLFAKINCDTPPVGSRMPYGFPSDTLTAQQQALIWDWIAAGAPIAPTDGVFRDSFDPRGFVP
jgi:hypothetical protein